VTDARAAARITTGLFLAHAFGSAGAIAIATVAAIAGAELSGRTSLAGLPGAAIQIGGALAALAVGLLTERLGRRAGLATAASLGAAGMIATVLAAIGGSFPWILVGLAVAGTASAAVKYARFTAAEVHPRARRGRAVAIVVMGGTVGSVVGPLLVAPTGAWSAAIGWGELAGPFLAALLAFAAAAACFALFLHPEPRELAARLETAGGDPRDLAPARPLRELARDRGVVTAFVTLVLAQGVMVMVMGITSLHMRGHDHALSAISAVFSGHTLGMFAFSLVSGWATDRFGRVPVLGIGGVLLVVSCLMAPLSPAFVPIFVALFLLGYGWNLCYVAGSALLADHLSTAEKAATQGVADLALGGVSALASLAGGVVFAVYGFTVMSVAGAVGAALLLIVVARYRVAAPAFAG
jgi:MFS family permease